MPRTNGIFIPDSARTICHVRSPELGDSELTYVHSWAGAAPPDVRPLLEVTLVDFADKIISHRGARQHVHSGLVGIRSPFEIGKLVRRHASDTRVRTLTLGERDLASAAELTKTRAWPPPGVLKYIDDRRLFARASAIFKAVEERATPLELQTRLAACASEVVRALAGAASAQHPSAHSSAERIRQLLHDRVVEEITLDDLAREVSLSRAYVVHAFQRAFHVPPHEYLMHLRVARARTMLLRGERPIDVAHACGFYDQSHLNRWFRKAVGVTPARYASAAS